MKKNKSNSLNNNADISKVTKVLIHKIHGGRKKDSKFWNDKVDLAKKSLYETPFEPKTKKSNLALFSLVSFAVLIVSCLVYTIYTFTNNQDQIIIKANDNHYTNKYEPLNKVIKPKPGWKINKNSLGQGNYSKKDRIAYAKKCFPGSDTIYCWKDQKGNEHYSNTGFPNGNNFTAKWVKTFK